MEEHFAKRIRRSRLIPEAGRSTVRQDAKSAHLANRLRKRPEGTMVLAHCFESRRKPVVHGQQSSLGTHAAKARSFFTSGLFA
jgi:hypothetical protein